MMLLLKVTQKHGIVFCRGDEGQSRLTHSMSSPGEEMFHQIGIEDSDDLATWIGDEFVVLCVRRNNQGHEARTGTLKVSGKGGMFESMFRGKYGRHACKIVALATGLNGHAKVIVVTVLESGKQETWRLYTDQPRRRGSITMEEIARLVAEAVR